MQPTAAHAQKPCSLGHAGGHTRTAEHSTDYRALNPTTWLGASAWTTLSATSGRSQEVKNARLSTLPTAGRVSRCAPWQPLPSLGPSEGVPQRCACEGALAQPTLLLLHRATTPSLTWSSDEKLTRLNARMCEAARRVSLGVQQSRTVPGPWQRTLGTPLSLERTGTFRWDAVGATRTSASGSTAKSISASVQSMPNGNGACRQYIVPKYQIVEELLSAFEHSSRATSTIDYEPVLSMDAVAGRSFYHLLNIETDRGGSNARSHISY